MCRDSRFSIPVRSESLPGTPIRPYFCRGQCMLFLLKISGGTGERPAPRHGQKIKEDLRCRHCARAPD